MKEEGSDEVTMLVCRHLIFFHRGAQEALATFIGVENRCLTLLFKTANVSDGRSMKKDIKQQERRKEA